MLGFLRRFLRSRWGRALCIAGALLLLTWAAAGIRFALLPKEYFISEVALRKYRADQVPDAVIERLQPISGQRFTDRSALVEAIRTRVGAPDFSSYRSTLERHVRSRACWPTEAAQKPHLLRDSRGQPAYGRFGVQVLVPQGQLPPVTTQLEFVPGNEGVLVLGKFGHLVWLGADFGLRLSTQVPGVYAGGEDQGALGLAVDPGFAANRFFYVGYVDEAGTHNVVRRFALSSDPAAVLKSGVDVIRFSKDAREPFHGIGALVFNRQGVMLVQVGDPTNHAQAWGDYQGKVLGIVPNAGAEGGYRRPELPLEDQLRALWQFGSPIVLAAGLRAPFTGLLWREHLIVGDVGGNGPWSTEEINVVTRRGDNFGWGACEDSALHANFKPPLIGYRRNDAETVVDDPDVIQTVARSVIVGAVYDGYRADRYQGLLDRRLVYGEFYQGFVRGARLNEQVEVVDDVFLLHLPFLSSMRLGPDGYLYGTTALGDKGLFRLTLKEPRRR